MEKITYQKLKEGYILKEGNVIDTIHGFEGLEVTGLTMCGKCWLHNHNGTNSAIYEYLGIADPKLECAAPEFKSLEELTKHVISLFEKSPYKVGDKVRILEREKAPSDYPFSFAREMEKYVGKIFTIQKIELNTICDWDKYNGDFHLYFLDEPDRWSWHSSMFEKIDSDSEIKEESMLEKKYKYEDDQRLTICGKTYRVHRNKDNNFLVNDGYSNRQVFIDLGIINNLKEEYKLYKWIEDHGFTYADGSFPPIIGDQFDDFVDLLLQIEKDQGIACQCSSKDSYKLGDKVRLGEDEYEISSNSRGYYLCNTNHGSSNSKMFKDLGVNTREWLKSRGFDYNDLGMFPEQRTLERLNEVIKALQNEFLFRKECKPLEDAILADVKPVPQGPELVWSLRDEISVSPEKLKFVKKKKVIHITL